MQYVLLFTSYGISVGVYYAMSTFLNQIVLAHYPVRQPNKKNAAVNDPRNKISRFLLSFLLSGSERGGGFYWADDNRRGIIWNADLRKDIGLVSQIQVEHLVFFCLLSIVSIKI